MLYLRSVAVGLATGSRSTLGLAAVAVSRADAGNSSSGPRRWTTRAATLACAGELIGDKLPQTPSRLEPVGLIARFALGAASGAIIARREQSGLGPLVLGAVSGAAGAGAASWLGAAWRRRATARFGQDLPGALVEDAMAITVATLAVARPLHRA